MPSFELPSTRQVLRCLWKATKIRSQQYVMYEEGLRSEFVQLSEK